MPPKPPRALFDKNPIFRNFIAATTVSLLGTNIFDWAIPVYVASRTQSVTALALATISLHLPFLIMAPLTGFIVDNFNKRRVMLASDIGQVVCMIFLLIYELSETQSLWPLFACVFVAKTLMITFETVATFQLIPSLVTPRELPEANTWFLSSQRLIQIIGPITAGSLLHAFGFKSCIGFNLLTFGATLYFVVSMKNLNELIYKNSPFREGATLSFSNVSSSFKESVQYIWNSPLFRPFVLMMFVWNLSSLVPGTPSIIHYFMVEKKFTSVQYGIVVSLVGFIGIIGFITASAIYRKHRFRKAFVGSATWLSGLSSASLLFLNYPMIMAFLFALSKAGSSVLSMGTFVLRQTNIPPAKMGGINAALRMFFMSSAPLSSALQGLILIHYGVGASFVLGALALWGTCWYARKVAIAYERIGEQWTENEAAA